MKRLAALAVAALAACGQQPRSDWERQHEDRLPQQEETAALPPYPRRGNLVEFFVSAANDFRFFVDRSSLSVSGDGVVRYTLIARSPSGVDNVSYEGLRCTSSQYRIYALGRPDGSWARQASGWREIVHGGAQRWHAALQREYFCPQREPVVTAEEGVRALEQGGHPFSTGLGAPNLGR